VPRARTVKYANRTDLNQPATEPVTAVPNQEYGQAGQQRAAQQAVPIGTPPTPKAAPVTNVPMASTNGPTQIAPGSIPFLNPTTRPDEPITAGLPFGAGPGPEVMNENVLPVHPVSTAFAQIAQSPNASSAVSSLAESARLLGL